MLKIEQEKCTGCGVCAASCPFGAIEMEGAFPRVNDSCVFCGNCEKECPAQAISLPQRKAGMDTGAYRDIWVVLEMNPRKNVLQKVSLELLSEAKRLAGLLGEKVGAVLLCEGPPKDFRQSVAAVGCDYARIVRDGALAQYNTDIYADVVTRLAQAYKPAGILFPATENGRDLAPRVSCALETGLTADCTALAIDEDRNLVQIRPTYGGNIMASIISPNHRPQLASVRPNVLSVVTQNTPTDTEFIREEIQARPEVSKTALLRSTEKQSVFKDVAESDVVIVAGYGIGSKENFKKLERLAVKMDAAIGATRKVVDEGWAPFEVQVGQTGKTVAPALYIACGVSGALQHTIGMKNAKHIIAINTDPAAPIFSMSDVAVMGDCMKVAEALLKRIRESAG